jgi:transposase-like protein
MDNTIAQFYQRKQLTVNKLESDIFLMCQRFMQTSPSNEEHYKTLNLDVSTLAKYKSKVMDKVRQSITEISLRLEIPYIQARDIYFAEHIYFE